MSTSKDLKTSITVNTEEQAIAFCLAIIRRVWSIDQQKRVVRTLAAFYKMTVADA